MDQGGVGGGVSTSTVAVDLRFDGLGTGVPGTLHLVLVGITVVAILFLVPLLGIGLTQLYGWQYFDAFSYFCLAVIAIGGISSPLVIGKGIEVMGLTERITAYTFYIWLAVMAYLLLGEAIG